MTLKADEKLKCKRSNVQYAYLCQNRRMWMVPVTI